MIKPHHDYIDKFVRLMLIVAIAACTFQLVYPLLGILSWGFILAVIFYPFYIYLNSHLGNRKILSAGIITFCILLLLASIAFFITNDIAHSVNQLTTLLQNKENFINTPPIEVQNIPVVGNFVYEKWRYAAANLQNGVNQYSNTILIVGRYGLGKLLDTSKDFLLFIIAVLFSGYLMVQATNFMAVMRQFAKRVAPINGLHLISMIRETIQNVSRGIIGISLIQTALFWTLLVIAKTPGAGLLSLLALIISIAQLGLFLLVIPIIIWLFITKNIIIAFIISAFLVLDALLDSFLKPYVMARGLSTPMIIIFIGVVGGILAYGMLGVFIGPAVLAIAYDLFQFWIKTDNEQTA